MNLRKSFYLNAFAACLYYSNDLIQDIIKFNFHQSPNFTERYGNKSYALVTGASEGIGFEFAKEFARQGFNLVLLSRSQDKLEIAAAKIREMSSAEIIVYPMDLMNAKESDFKALFDSTSDIDISILVNNAGMILYKPNNEITYSEINNIVNLNSLAAARMMHFFLPRLEVRPKKSAVINVSSILAVQPCPVLALHSASKAFIHYLTVGLSQKYLDKIDFLSFQPGWVKTKMMVSDDNPTMIEAPIVVTECLKDLGRKEVSHGHWKHTIVAYLMHLVPQRFRLNKIAEYLNRDLDLSKKE